MKDEIKNPIHCLDPSFDFSPVPDPSAFGTSPLMGGASRHLKYYSAPPLGGEETEGSYTEEAKTTLINQTNIMAKKKTIELNKIFKDYYIWEQVIPVLKGVDLDVKEWEFVSIMWHSGSGKSTLMNLIWFLDNPTSGEYIFEWKDVANLSTNKRAEIRGKKIWFIFQTYNLIPRKSAIEQVMLPLAYQWVDLKTRKERAQKALIKVWLEDKMHNKPNELSWWQQQRVAIARALVIDPAIILADEPTGALDSTTGDEVMNIITELHQEWKTIILITHEQNISDYAERSILVKDGLVVDKL